jgi:hypothetical protein
VLIIALPGWHRKFDKRFISTLSFDHTPKR